ncbi:MAG: hypothetical protein PVJ21_05100 [Anaerolineales bacterium]|jgi:hypothetical protein
MLRNRKSLILLVIVLVFFLTACDKKNTVCPPHEGTARPTLQLAELIETTSPGPSSGSVRVEIQGKPMEVDKIVDYPLCNDNWSGIVYVNCDVQIAEAELDAEANPLFLKGCNLNIEPNTVVYVAAHNDAAYYKGCSCHMGAAPLP